MQELSDGLLLRIGSREGSQQKARRYLLEGRVMVRSVGPQGVRAHVRGQGFVYNVGYEAGGGWSCTCPARTPKCCHAIAVQIVVVVPQGQAVSDGLQHQHLSTSIEAQS